MPVESAHRRPAIGTLWRTVRHLRPEQVLGRLRFKLHNPAPDLRQAPPLRKRTGPWATPAMREPSLVAVASLRLLNTDHDLDRLGWDCASVDKLLRYNLHYFDDLNARDSKARSDLQRDLVERWIRANPPGVGTGWEPYPVSVRLVNWIKWLMGGAQTERHWLDSIAAQARWLSERLEWHLLGNHLFSNAKALVFAGLCFEGAEAERLLGRGIEIMQRELDEQILADGGQFERSPMYHALALEDVLDTLNVVAALPHPVAEALQPELRATAGRMLYWLRCLTHADGSLGLFNDCAEGVAASLQELDRYAGELGVRAPPAPLEGMTHFPQSGYVRAARGGAIALLDVAPVGPDYLPAHAHADTLSFELSVRGQRVIVNGGTSCYGAGEQRQRERGTAAHSTVQVAEADSSEVWSGFRVGRRARPGPVSIEARRVCCSHDGYRFLPGRPEHRRCWRIGLGELAVDDAVTTSELAATARYILAPGLRLRERESQRWSVVLGNQHIADVEVTVGRAQVVAARHAPRFGVLVPVECLSVALAHGRASTRWTWTE